MTVLFANIPFIKQDENGICTGPNAGSRWPWTAPGITDYGPFPFFMAYAVRYLQLNGVDAKFYDGVAERHWDYNLVRKTISEYRPEILFLETSTPLVRTIGEFAAWAKESFGSRIVLVGPHVQAYAQELIKEPFVDQPRWISPRNRNEARRYIRSSTSKISTASSDRISRRSGRWTFCPIIGIRR